MAHFPDGNSTPLRPTLDRNFQPRTSYLSRNILSQFSPITPDQSKRAQNKEAHDNLTLNDERENQESEKQKNNVVDTSEFEVEELPKDLYGAAVSTQLQESRKPDKAGNLAIDLNRTPQQKPRRRKHRPKVVIEGKPKRTRKPATPTGTPKGKRKYVRKNKLEKIPGTPTTEAAGRTTDPEPAPPAAEFCKRKLNFDSESQMTEEQCYSPWLQSNTSRAQNLYTRVESNSHEQTREGIAYQLTCSMNNVVEECRSAPSPQTHTRTDPMGIPGMCFPANYKRKRTVKRKSSNTSWALSTVTVAENTARQGIHWSMNNGLAACTLATYQFISSSMSTENASVIGAQGREQTFEWKLALNQKGRMSKKRTKGRTARHNFGSLIEFVKYRHRPTFCAEGGTTVDVMTGHELLYHPPTQMGAAMKRKKQTKRNPFANSGAQGREQTFEWKLALNQKGRMSKKRTKGRTARHNFGSLIEFVEYRHRPTFCAEGGTTVDVITGHELLYHPPTQMGATMKRKKQIKRNPFANSAIIKKKEECLKSGLSRSFLDGADEEKEKWWERERRVFEERAKSFIARMHLVQGDRRFSPWKGSVLDSIIGVFLTQNVSDHLSSSAFMSLAAHFPIKSKSNERPCSSSQNSMNSMAHTGERIRSFFPDNSEAADPGLKPNLHSLVDSSFMELLKRLEESSGGVKQNQSVQQVQEVSNLTRETLDAIDSNSSVNKPQNTEHKDVESCLIDHEYLPGTEISGMCSDSSKVKRGRIGETKQNTKDWDNLRLQAQTKGTRRERTTNTIDSLDWEAVRCADVNEIAYTIRERGMNNRLAERIKDFLNRLVRDHGSMDLEWLRDVPPDKAKEYMLSVRGLGLKSVECVRLLTLHHLAFPVDTNVGRIAVRLGWVPLQRLPDSLQLHLLELYPVLESIQRYLWPRLCKLDQRTLYQLHYQMITFGKVFCTKSKPNCNACPMRGECRHFASAFASARLALPGPEEKSIVKATQSKATNQNPMEIIKLLQLPLPQANQQLQGRSQSSNCEPIVEMPATPEPTVEVPDTPELEPPEVLERDIEDALYKDPEEIPMIKLNIEEFTQNLQHYMQQNMELCEGDISKALVALTPEAASIPIPKLKYINRLRTEHRVYKLPDSHPLLEGLDNRDPHDPCSYLLAIWTPGETANSIEQPEKRCISQEYGNTCNENTCFSCNTIREENSQIVRGTILIPCRTAMRGSFPLNGTYFQVNEVFADHESSINPIDVPRTWIWDLPRCTVFFGTSIPTILKGLSMESIQYCFWRGFVCLRGFERKTRAPRPLMARLHFPASKLKGAKGDTNVKREL